jgi:hypothetical protein
VSRRWGRSVGLVAAVGLLFVTLAAGTAHAQDPSTGLSNAESTAASAELEVASSREQLSAAEARYEAMTREAAPARRKSRSAQTHVRQMRADLVARKSRAAAHVSRREAEHDKGVAQHNDRVKNGIGFALAALVAAAIALGWGWFRASAAIAALSELSLGQAIGLCVGGGFVLLIASAGLGGADGVVGALGVFFLFLGFVLPTALLLGRHSAEIQRGRAAPVLRQERMPEWVTRLIAGLMAAIFLVGLGQAVFADSAGSSGISTQLRDEAEKSVDALGGRELATAGAEAARLQHEAAGPIAEQNSARRALREAGNQVHRAERKLARATANARYFTRRLAAVMAHEEREAAKAAELAEREAEEVAEEEAELAAEACDPNYSGCLDPNSPDYDCEGGSGDGPDYTGTVTVLGTDHYGLDDDGDGIGCDP